MSNGDSAKYFGEVRSAIVQKGDDRRRGIAGNREGRDSQPSRIQTKMILRDNDNLEDYIEVDYNPTIWPFEAKVEYNDKTIIGGQDALEFKSRKNEDFTLEFLFTDFGSHTPKTQFKQTTEWKLSWLESKSKSSIHYDEESSSFVNAPTVLMLERALNTDRVVIVKLAYKIELFNSVWQAQRARVQITFRKVFQRRKRKGGSGRRNI